MKRTILIILIGISFKVYSQKKHEIESSFIQHFLEEKILVIVDRKSREIEYNPGLIELNVNEVGNYYPNFVFYKFEIGLNEINIDKDKYEVFFNSSSCNQYFLAFDLFSNRSYRIKGFYGNDLLSLIKDINNSSYSSSNTKSIIRSLDELKIEVDFKGIFKAIKRFDFEADCLKACIEPKESHGKIK